MNTISEIMEDLIISYVPSHFLSLSAHAVATLILFFFKTHIAMARLTCYMRNAATATKLCSIPKKCPISLMNMKITYHIVRMRNLLCSVAAIGDKNYSSYFDPYMGSFLFYVGPLIAECAPTCTLRICYILYRM